MPNWCHNTLLVRGEEEEVAPWVIAARQPAEASRDDGSPLYFSAFVPEPADIGEGWWDWRITHWGTKWEPTFANPGGIPDSPTATHPGMRRSKGRVEYTFDSAWGPPIEWLFQVARQFPSLSFEITYGEPGMDFGGKIAFADGKVVSDERGDAEQYLSEEMMWF